MELTAAEKNQVRMSVHTTLEATDLSDTQIESSLILGSAVDYVVGEILRNINLSAFTDTQQRAFLAIKDGTTASLTAFENTCLVGAQQGMFRRAVVYRAAANAYPMVKITGTERAFDLTNQYDLMKPEAKLAWLQEQSDFNILNLKNLFQDDAYIDVRILSPLVGVLGR